MEVQPRWERSFVEERFVSQDILRENHSIVAREYQRTTAIIGFDGASMPYRGEHVRRRPLRHPAHEGEVRPVVLLLFPSANLAGVARNTVAWARHQEHGGGGVEMKHTTKDTESEIKIETPFWPGQLTGPSATTVRYGTRWL